MILSDSLQLLRQAWMDLRRGLRPTIIYLIGWAVVYGALLAPVSSWVLGRFITTGGRLAISNYDISSFLLSPLGILFLLLFGVVHLSLFYAQQSGLFLMARQVQLGHSVRVAALLQGNLKRIPALARLACWQLLGFTLLTLPFALVLVLVYTTLLGAQDINFYLATQPPAWQWAVRIALATLLAYAVVASVLFLRWVLALPYLLVSRETPWQCLKKSWRTTRTQVWRLAVPLLLWWGGFMVVSLAVGSLFVVLTQPLLQWAGLNVHRLAPVLLVVETALLAGGIVVSFLATTMHQFLLARLYGSLHPDVSPAEAVGSAPGRGTATLKLTARVAVPVLLGMSVWSTWWHAKTLDLKFQVLITAHRGSSVRAPENTLSALRQAIAEGADYVEIDVQSTRDGQVVLIHDADLKRVGNDPRKVADLTLEQLREIDVGSRFSAEFKGERVPTLAEAIATAQPKARLNIELKYNRPDPQLADRVIQVAQAEKFLSECVITSLDFQSLRQVETIAPEVDTGLIVTAALGDVLRLPVDFFSMNASKVNSSFISLAHRHDKAVHVWTVNDRKSMLQMILAGVDNIITDEPALLATFLRELNELSDAEKMALALRSRLGR